MCTRRRKTVLVILCKTLQWYCVSFLALLSSDDRAERGMWTNPHVRAHPSSLDWLHVFMVEFLREIHISKPTWDSQKHRFLWTPFPPPPTPHKQFALVFLAFTVVFAPTKTSHLCVKVTVLNLLWSDSKVPSTSTSPPCSCPVFSSCLPSYRRLWQWGRSEWKGNRWGGTINEFMLITATSHPCANPSLLLETASCSRGVVVKCFALLWFWFWGSG